MPEGEPGKARRKPETDRYRESSRAIAEQLREAKRSGVVARMRVLVSSDACGVCQGRRDIIFPIKTCTPADLPPYRDCEYEDGCDSCVVEELTPEYSGPRRSLRVFSKDSITPKRQRIPFRISAPFGVALVVSFFALVWMGPYLWLIFGDLFR